MRIRSFRHTNRLLLGLMLAAPLLSSCQSTRPQVGDPEVYKWAVHDPNRPVPTAVTPGQCDRQPAPAPSDAVVLFGGDDLSRWVSAKDGAPAKWKVGDGYFEVVKGTGQIQTKQEFGDMQLHVEWASPKEVVGESQGRGNSGIFLMNTYEVQVLDTYNNKTYADGGAGSLYGQYPPMANVTCKPGEWNTYDIFFRAPRFDAGGKLLKPAYVTVVHNGVLVQDHVELTGPTAHKERPAYKAHPAKLPIGLQDHNNPVRFRNIWVRELQ